MQTIGEVIGPVACGRFGRTWTDDQLRAAVPVSRSRAEVCGRLGVSRRNPVVAERIRTLGLNTAHFTSQTTRAEQRQLAVSLEDILRSKRLFGSSYVKKRLLKAGLLTYHCYQCKITSWCGKPLTLQLDHIDGNNQNHALENLRLLCPNCHSQTETYAGRNLTQRMIKKFAYLCKKCERPVSTGASFCRVCAPKRATGQTWPSLEELRPLLDTVGPLAASRRLGVSRHVLYEHLRKIGYYA